MLYNYYVYLLNPFTSWRLKIIPFTQNWRFEDKIFCIGIIVREVERYIYPDTFALLPFSLHVSRVGVMVLAWSGLLWIGRICSAHSVPQEIQANFQHKKKKDFLEKKCSVTTKFSLHASNQSMSFLQEIIPCCPLKFGQLSDSEGPNRYLHSKEDSRENIKSDLISSYPEADPSPQRKSSFLDAFQHCSVVLSQLQINRHGMIQCLKSDMKSHRLTQVLDVFLGGPKWHKLTQIAFLGNSAFWIPKLT